MEHKFQFSLFVIEQCSKEVLNIQTRIKFLQKEVGSFERWSVKISIEGLEGGIIEAIEWEINWWVKECLKDSKMAGERIIRDGFSGIFKGNWWKIEVAWRSEEIKQIIRLI